MWSYRTANNSAASGKWMWVLAIDIDNKKLGLASQFGAEICNSSLGENVLAAGLAFSRGKGVDGVIITAESKSNVLVKQAAQMCRIRGRIILVGVVGLNIDRAEFDEKEISCQVSWSYGPGRYDQSYEQDGQIILLVLSGGLSRGTSKHSWICFPWEL